MPLDTTIALLAADLHHEHKLATADAIVYATAQHRNAELLTCDAQSISLRLPTHLLERIRAAANARDVPYQSLIKVWLEEKVST